MQAAGGRPHRHRLLAAQPVAEGEDLPVEGGQHLQRVLNHTLVLGGQQLGLEAALASDQLGELGVGVGADGLVQAGDHARRLAGGVDVSAVHLAGLGQLVVGGRSTQGLGQLCGFL